jgi:hypothetical protein
VRREDWSLINPARLRNPQSIVEVIALLPIARIRQLQGHDLRLPRALSVGPRRCAPCAVAVRVGASPGPREPPDQRSTKNRAGLTNRPRESQGRVSQGRGGALLGEAYKRIEAKRCGLAPSLRRERYSRTFGSLVRGGTPH